LLKQIMDNLLKRRNSMADFVDGVWVDTVETQYGDIIKLSFDIDKFIRFLAGSEHVNLGKNGRKYLNVEIKKAKPKEGEPPKHYMAVDTWKPPQETNDNPDENVPF